MDTSFVVRLENRAKTMLPPAVVMCVECAGDASGDEKLIALLEEIEGKGVRGEALCPEGYDTIVFEDRVLLRCAGCARGKALPRFRGIGYGKSEAEARQNALYALTLPPGRPNTTGPFLSEMRFGEGPHRAEETACVFNRAAYLHGLP